MSYNRITYARNLDTHVIKPILYILFIILTGSGKRDFPHKAPMTPEWWILMSTNFIIDKFRFKILNILLIFYRSRRVKNFIQLRKQNKEKDKRKVLTLPKWFKYLKHLIIRTNTSLTKCIHFPILSLEGLMNDLLVVQWLVTPFYFCLLFQVYLIWAWAQVFQEQLQLGVPQPVIFPKKK